MENYGEYEQYCKQQDLSDMLVQKFKYPFMTYGVAHNSFCGSVVDWHIFDADPDADPTFYVDTLVGKSESFVVFSSQHCQSSLFYHS
jgi:hypothetical protein